jgi:hypothetical protein
MTCRLCGGSKTLVAHVFEQWESGGKGIIATRWMHYAYPCDCDRGGIVRIYIGEPDPRRPHKPTKADLAHLARLKADPEPDTLPEAQGEQHEPNESNEP